MPQPLAPSPTAVWAALARMLTHVYLRTERAGGPSVHTLRSLPMLRAMWTCTDLLRLLIEADPASSPSDLGWKADLSGGGGAPAEDPPAVAPRLLTRAILPCIHCYLGGYTGAAQRLLATSSAPQRALLSLLHASLLKLAAYHVAVGMRASRSV